MDDRPTRFADFPERHIWADFDTIIGVDYVERRWPVNVTAYDNYLVQELDPRLYLEHIEPPTTPKIVKG